MNLGLAAAIMGILFLIMVAAIMDTSLVTVVLDLLALIYEKEKQIGKSSGDKEVDTVINPALTVEVETLKCTEKEKEIDLLQELPVGIIDEEPAISKFEKCELHETGEGNTLSSTEGCLAGYQSDKQLLEAASDNCVKGQKEEEFTKNPEFEVEAEQTEETEVSNNNKFESVLKPEEVPPR